MAATAAAATCVALRPRLERPLGPASMSASDYGSAAAVSHCSYLQIARRHHPDEQRFNRRHTS